MEYTLALWALKYLQRVSSYPHPVLPIPHVCECGWVWKVHPPCLLLSDCTIVAFSIMCLLYELSQPLAFLCWKQLANTPKGALVTSEGTMTGAPAPFGVHLRICQLYMSRNGSLVMPCVSCARTEPLRLVILAVRLCLGLPGHLCPAVPQARGHAWPLSHGVSCPKWDKWSTEKVHTHIAEMLFPMFLCRLHRLKRERVSFMKS